MKIHIAKQRNGWSAWADKSEKSQQPIVHKCKNKYDAFNAMLQFKVTQLQIMQMEMKMGIA